MGHFLIQLCIHHAGSSGLSLPACLHLRILAECLSTETLLWSCSRALLRAPTKESAGIAPGCAHQVTIPRWCSGKRVPFYHKARHTHAWFWITGTPMPSSGLQAHPCLVLDRGHTHAWFWIAGIPMPGSGSQTYSCLVLDHRHTHV